jgi:hypothetical protein
MRLLRASPVARFYLAFAGLFLNLVGAVLIFLAFSFSSSAVNIYPPVSGTIYLEVNGQHSAIGIGSTGVVVGGAPNLSSSGQIALLNSNHPAFAWTGLVLVIVSFIPSMMSLEFPTRSDAQGKTNLAPSVDVP